jgi:hypothetical protein
MEGAELRGIKMRHLVGGFSLTAKPDGQSWKIQRGQRQTQVKTDPNKPLVTHGNFYLFVLNFMAKVEREEELIFDFFIPEDNRLVELKLVRSEVSPSGKWSLKMEATSVLMKLFLRPFFLDFDSAKKIIVSGEVLDPIFSKDRMKVRYFSTQSG